MELRVQAEDIATRLLDAVTWDRERGGEEPTWRSIDHEVGHSLVRWAPMRERELGWER